MSSGTAHAGVLGRLQKLIEKIYDIDAVYRVGDFVITDPRQVACIDPGGRVTREKLLVASAGGGLEVSLFVDQDVLHALVDADPFEALHDDNLDDFCTAVEGVSHFTYVAWNAAYDKRVTLLELELQAEVDKFITAAVLLKKQNPGRLSAALCHRLFEKISFAADIDQIEFDRYRHASRWAAHYCRRLQQLFPRGARILTELRRFYRLPKLAKIRRIGASTTA